MPWVVPAAHFPLHPTWNLLSPLRVGLLQIRLTSSLPISASSHTLSDRSAPSNTVPEAKEGGGGWRLYEAPGAHAGWERTTPCRRLHTATSIVLLGMRMSHESWNINDHMQVAAVCKHEQHTTAGSTDQDTTMRIALRPRPLGCLVALTINSSVLRVACCNAQLPISADPHA